jgi:ankyrin repeat protein
MTDQEKLFIESCFKGDLKTIKSCVKFNVDIHIENDWCIDIASRNNHFELIKFLLENGISDEAASKKKILAYSIHNNNLELTKYLINRSDEYKNDSTSVQWAAANGKIEAIKLLLPFINDLRWVYCNAAKHGHVDLIHYLNDNSIYNHDSAMNLVLNWAANGRKWNAIKVLVEENIVDFETLSETQRLKYEQWKDTAN